MPRIAAETVMIETIAMKTKIETAITIKTTATETAIVATTAAGIRSRCKRAITKACGKECVMPAIDVETQATATTKVTVTKATVTKATVIMAATETRATADFSKLTNKASNADIAKA